MNLQNINRTYENISNKKRNNLIRLVFEQNYTIKSAAIALDIKYSTAKTIIKKYERTSNSCKENQGGKRFEIVNEDILNKIENIVESNGSLTLKEIKTKLLTSLNNFNFQISLNTIDRCLQKIGISLKNNHKELYRVNLPDKIELRKEYSLWFNNFFLGDYRKIIFIDETSFNLHLRRTRSRSKIGTRANVMVPTVRGRSISLIASMSINGMHFYKIVSNSTVNSNIFNDYINELCQYLQDVLNMQEAFLIFDNARIHKYENIERILSTYNFHFKFLSPYSYMLNPIENSFSKLKNCVRSQLRLGNNETLSNIISSQIENISVRDCREFFQNTLRNITNCAAGLPYHH